MVFSAVDVIPAAALVGVAPLIAVAAVVDAAALVDVAVLVDAAVGATSVGETMPAPDERQAAKKSIMKHNRPYELVLPCGRDGMPIRRGTRTRTRGIRRDTRLGTSLVTPPPPTGRSRAWLVPRMFPRSPGRSRHAPQLHRAVQRSRCQSLPVWREGHAVHTVRMPLHGAKQCTVRHPPPAHLVPSIAGCQ